MARFASLLLLLLLTLAAPGLAQEGNPLDKPAQPDAGAKPFDKDAPVVVPEEAWTGVTKGPRKLVHTFQKGGASRYAVKQRTEVDQGPMGSQTMEQVFEVRREVVDAPAEGGARLKETYEQVVFTIEAQGQTLTMDTRDGTSSGNPVIDAMGGMVGGSTESRVAKDGRVEQVTGAGDLVGRILEKTPEEHRPMLEQNLGQSMTDEKLGQQMQESLVVFPDKELASGDSWRRETTNEIPNLGSLAMFNDYVYLGTVEHGGVECAKLHVRIRSPGKEKFETMLQGTPATISMPGFETSSTILVRASDGEPVEGGPVVVTITVHVEVAGQALTVVNKTTSHSVRLADGEKTPEGQKSPLGGEAPR